MRRDYSHLQRYVSRSAPNSYQRSYNFHIPIFVTGGPNVVNDLQRCCTGYIGEKA